VIILAGNWLVNAVMGLIGFLFTFVFTFFNNTWQTSLFRAGAGFLLFFLTGYLFRLVLHQNGSIPAQTKEEEPLPKQEKVNESADAKNDQTAFEALPLHDLHKEKNSK
jgi:uncharacterized membrane protein YraQ (UPF0718 family)